MDSQELDEIKDLIFDISKESELGREDIEEVVGALRSLIDAYAGATRRLYKIRSKLREER